MKYLMMIVLMFSAMTASADDVVELCDNTAYLAYLVAEQYYQGTSIAQLHYLAESRLEISMIYLVRDEGVDSITAAKIYHTVCMDDPDFILNLLYLPK